MAIILTNDSGFQVYFPELGGAMTPQAGQASPFTSIKTRILYVDDEPKTMYLGHSLLESLGFRVSALASSLEARELFHNDSQAFDLVITDLAMPQMSGLELSADLLKFRPDLPIILYSGSDEPVAAETARQLGIREFLTKPVTVLDLAKAIGRALGPEYDLDQNKGETMDGNPGNGSGYQVYLPGSGQAATSQTEITAPFPPTRERILYVDDDPHMVKVGQRVLRYLGYRVTALTSSLEAREVFHDHPQEFDLVITDMVMPRLTGMDLAADLIKIRPDLPIIVCSSFIDTVSPDTARKLGIREFLMKPVTIEDLARAIRRALDYGQE